MHVSLLRKVHFDWIRGVSYVNKIAFIVPLTIECYNVFS